MLETLKELLKSQALSTESVEIHADTNHFKRIMSFPQLIRLDNNVHRLTVICKRASEEFVEDLYGFIRENAIFSVPYRHQLSLFFIDQFHPDEEFFGKILKVKHFSKNLKKVKLP
jgi:hypothetical protein